MGDRERIDQLHDRVVRLERQVEKLSKHLNLAVEEPDSDIPDSVMALALAGKEHDAVKEYRRLTGAGLKHSLAVVKNLRSEL